MMKTGFSIFRQANGSSKAKQLTIGWCGEARTPSAPLCEKKNEETIISNSNGAALMGGCDGGVKTTAITKCSSPGGKYTATFYVEQAGGAAGSQYEFVEITEKGKEKKFEIMRLKGAYDIAFRWLGEEKLDIGYPEEARVDHWQSSFGSDFNGKSSVKTVPSRGGEFVDRTLAGCK